MRNFLIAATAALAIGAGPASAESPVVVELYTSEGCNSCPPAEEYLFDLRERDNVIALAFHVDYWDYLGWKDRFASEAFTNRQRGYARAMGEPMIYTPQLVVGGAQHVVGSDRRRVDAVIDHAAQQPAAIAIGMAWSESRALTISIPEADYDGNATIWFARYILDAESDVTSGENAGKHLVHANIVDELTAIGMWNGAAMDIMLPWESIVNANGDHGFGGAIIVQPEGLGPILGAREITYDQMADAYQSISRSD
ncbi:MAG: DUF1223 domain-containing protein [Rhodospirillales bacterium]|nr:DUF1223 domain-containing protein [Rhodospirillales bacterium]